MTIILAIILLAVVVIGGLVWFSASTARKVEAALPPCGTFKEVNGARLHFVDTGGTTPPIVMIHGLGGNLLHYKYALSDHLADDFRLILIDRPGSGYSTRTTDDATLGAQASAIAELIRALGLKRPLLVGHSLGGALSLALALDHPDCVGALALLAPLTHTQEKVPEIFQGLLVESRLMRKIIAWTLAIPLGIRHGATSLAVVFAPDTVVPDFALRAGGLLSLRPNSFISASSDIVALRDELQRYIKRYPSLDVPAGILFGTEDNILDHRKHGEAMKAACPALDLELIKGGHMPLIIVPDRCEALIRRVAARQQQAQHKG